MENFHNKTKKKKIKINITRTIFQKAQLDNLFMIVSIALIVATLYWSEEKKNIKFIYYLNLLAQSHNLFIIIHNFKQNILTEDEKSLIAER